MKGKTIFSILLCAVFLLPALLLADPSPTISTDIETPRASMRQSYADANNPSVMLITQAQDIYTRLTSTNTDTGKQFKLTSEAQCLALFPEVTEGGLIIGGKTGTGVVTCKTDSTGKNWSQISFIDLSAMSVGAQIGAKSSQLALFYMNEKAKNALTQGKFALGGDLTITTGTAEAALKADTDTTSVIGISEGKGALLSASLSGSRISPDEDAIMAYYGKKMNHEQLLTTQFQQNTQSEAAKNLIRTITQGTQQL